MHITPIIEIAQQAGQCILSFWRRSITVSLKADRSPVTAADQAAHQVIEQGLRQVTPALPILSEEGPLIGWAQRKQWTSYWLVDPLDGTKDFLQGRAEFTVNIALIDQHMPILSVMYAPAVDKLYYAIQGQGAYLQQGQTSAQPVHVCESVSAKPRIASSRFHPNCALQSMLTQLGEHQLIIAGSSLKFGLIAEGLADVYLRFGPTCEWDTAAGQCILEAAGGQVVDFNQQPLRYNQQASLINPHFLACGDASQRWCAMAAGSTT
ncbi:MAG: 3'(2'),5'-bisphosphate nucleotidase CysQ [Legionellales bacterium]|nr:3'(2'),5'-bisphosphate nucleotidase CysQ [Legionellales bacterium]